MRDPLQGYPPRPCAWCQEPFGEWTLQGAFNLVLCEDHAVRIVNTAWKTSPTGWVAALDVWLFFEGHRSDGSAWYRSYRMDGPYASLFEWDYSDC